MLSSSVARRRFALPGTTTTPVVGWWWWWCVSGAFARVVVCAQSCVLSNPKEHKRASSKNGPHKKMSLPFVRSFVPSSCVNLRSQRELYLGFNTSSVFFRGERETNSLLLLEALLRLSLSLSSSSSSLALTRNDTGRGLREGRLEERARDF